MFVGRQLSPRTLDTKVTWFSGLDWGLERGVVVMEAAVTLQITDIEANSIDCLQFTNCID